VHTKPLAKESIPFVETLIRGEMKWQTCEEKGASAQNVSGF
jgi:hypothetical protein